MSNAFTFMDEKSYMGFIKQFLHTKHSSDSNQLYFTIYLKIDLFLIIFVLTSNSMEHLLDTMSNLI